MQPPEKESPVRAEHYDTTDPDNRPLNREERRALREQDRLMEKRRQARKAREAPRSDQAREQRTGPDTPGT
ncbi:hypothetical protein [Nocardiopsis kunsanensis]|nr:hypothetical protein [Nocardiopsis kunsanensis]